MTMTTTNETEITVDQDVPMVRIVREFRWDAVADREPYLTLGRKLAVELHQGFDGPDERLSLLQAQIVDSVAQAPDRPPEGGYLLLQPGA